MLPSAVTLLPTPAVNDMGEGKTPDAWDAWDAWTANMQERHGNGNGHGKSLSIEAQRLLPTTTAGDAAGSRNRTAWRSKEPPTGIHVGDTLTDIAWQHDGHSDPRMPSSEPWQDWGIYADAIARWEHLTRPAPAPTQPSKKGTPQLSPRFSEWLMGLPEGHVTAVPGLTRNAQLKALGNGVVPQQAVLALRLLMAHVTEAAA
jgi:DNA (cytosine-5)-methyltransferase 1